MLIGKPARIILSALISGVFVGIVSGLLEKPWLGLFIGFPVYFITDFVIDLIDLWLRKKTKDQVWLCSYEGKEWLKSEEGQIWKQRQRNN